MKVSSYSGGDIYGKVHKTHYRAVCTSRWTSVHDDSVCNRQVLAY